MRLVLAMLGSLLLASTSFAAPFRVPDLDLKINPELFRIPDLEITEATILSQNVQADGSTQVRLRVTVRNDGLGSAVRFKLAAEAQGLKANPRGYYAVPLHATGSAFSWYSFTDGLAAGQSRTLRLTAILSKNFNANPTLRITADSCSGEEFAASYCRVAEMDERNNTAVAR